ncbi:MAG: 50S ribosomal protein L24 [Aquificaceae bacterium]
MASRIKKGDSVVVVRGKERGKTGEVIEVMKDELVVKDTNIVKKHVKGVPNVREGGIYEMEAPIHISNVMLVCPKCEKPTRVGFRIEGDGNTFKKYRYCKKCNESLDLVTSKERAKA